MRCNRLVIAHSLCLDGTYLEGLVLAGATQVPGS